MKHLYTLAALLLLSSCSSGTPEVAAPNKDAQATKQIEQEAKSIEQAADQAAKLIEEDAKLDEMAP